MKIINLFACIICLSIYVSGQNPYYVGHSLINLNIPFMVKELRTAAGQTTQYRNHINNGASLKTQWSDPSNWNYNPIWTPSLVMDVDHGTNFLTALNPSATLKFDHVIITESVPLLDNPADTTIKYGRLFHNLALSHNTPITSSMMQTWEYVAGGNYANWRNTFNTYITHWENRVNGIQNGTAQQMKIIPCGLALAALYDTLQIHAIGSLTSMSQLFSDAIHLNHTGNAFMSYVMYACIYRISPEGLPAVKAGPYTNDMAITDPVIRTKLQQIAWTVATSYSRSPVYNIPLAIKDVACFDVKEEKFDKVGITFCVSEQNKGKDITIQRSVNGITFENVKTLHNVKKGEIYTQFPEYLKGMIYYRLAHGSDYSETKSLFKNTNLFIPTLVSDYIESDFFPDQSLKMYDKNGMLVKKVFSTGTRIDISDLSRGLYYIRINSQTFSIIKV